MKKRTLFSFYLLITIVLVSCSGAASNDKAPDTAVKANDAAPAAPSKTKPKKYATVAEMIDSSGDFASDNGTFKLLSSSPLHIQVSSIIMTGTTTDEQIKTQTLDNIVYVAYQAFASTNINNITITAVPLMFDSEKQKSAGYNNAFKTTLTINRDKAKSVMQQFVGLSNFEDLLGADGGNGQYLPDSPGPKFEQLKSTDNVEKVVRALKE